MEINKEEVVNKFTKWQTHLYVILLVAFFSAGCDGKSPDIDNSSQDESFLTASINGEPFASSLEIVAFRIKGQTHLATADNKSGADEYEVIWIIQNDKQSDPSKTRSGYIELKDSDGDRKKNKMWQLPNNFTFELTDESERHLEGTFSFTAKELMGSDQLVVTNGKFRANKKGGF